MSNQQWQMGVLAMRRWINYFSSEQSDWQFSKLYIWNYHLSDSDFTEASLALNSELTSTKNLGHFCAACPPNSTSPPASTSAAACACAPGFTGPNANTCVARAAGTFKNETGPAACQACPAFATSAQGSTLRTNCTCSEGYKGVLGGTCGKICPPGAEHGPLNQVCYACNTSTYKPLAGDHKCTPLPAFSHHALTNQTWIDSCMCQIG